MMKVRLLLALGISGLLCGCEPAVSTIGVEWQDDVASSGFVTLQFMVKYDGGLTDPAISFTVQEDDDGTAAAVLLRSSYNSTSGCACRAERSGSLLTFDCGSDSVQEIQVKEGSGSWQVVPESGVTLPCGLTVRSKSVTMP